MKINHRKRAASKTQIEGRHLTYNGLRVRAIFDTLHYCKFHYFVTVRFDGSNLSNPSSNYDGERKKLLDDVLRDVRSDMRVSCRRIHHAASVEYGQTERAHLHILYSIYPDPNYIEKLSFEGSLERAFNKRGVTDVHIEEIEDQMKCVSYVCKVENVPYDYNFILSEGFAEILWGIKERAIQGATAY